MNLRSLLLVCLLALLAFTATGQKEVRITVWDKDTRQPIYLAYVNTYSAEHEFLSSMQTNEEGAVTTVPGSYPFTVEVVAIGYEAVIKTVRDSVTNNDLAFFVQKKNAALNEVVVTGISQPVRLQDALSNYKIITKAAMQAQGAVTLNDALRTQLNIDLGQDNATGAATMRMQGLGGDKVKILIDGVPLYGREFGGIDLSQINLNNVERIEIVQGPMSTVYGTDALGGVVNVITKKENIPFHLQAGGLYENIGKYNFDGSVSFRAFKNHQFTIGGGRNFFQGWGTLDTLGRSSIWKPKEQYLGNLAYSYSKGAFKLHFGNDFVTEKITSKDPFVIITPFEAYASSDLYFRNTRLNSRLQLDGKLGKTGAWQMQNAYSLYHRTKNTYYTNLVTLDQALSQSLGSQDTTNFNDYTLRGSYTNSIKKVRITAGYDVLLENGNSKKIQNGTKNKGDYAGYATADIPFFSSKLTLQPGLRATYNTLYKAPVVPSVNLLYKKSDAVQFRASYGRGFRAPTLKELYLEFIDINHEVIGNPDLKAEKGHHAQASTSWTFYSKQANYSKLLVTAFYNDVDNQITLMQPDSNRPMYATYTNVNKFKNAIVTVQTDGQFGKLYWQIGYSLQTILDNSISNTTSNDINAILQYSWAKPGVNLSTFYKYTGKQARLVPTIDGGAAFDGTQYAFSMWDASVEKKFWEKRLQLIVGVKNLLNIKNVGVTGSQSSGVHSGGGTPGINTLSIGRSVFTSLRLNID